MNDKTEQVAEKPLSFPAQVWGKLSRIDVADYIETKGEGRFQAAYLSWSNAWAFLMRAYPESHYNVILPDAFADGTQMVVVTVAVIEGENTLQRNMSLPVMDHKFQPVQSPNARQVSDASMRCLVKCLALFGLGLDLWADTDGPVGVVDDPLTPEQADLIFTYLDKSEADVERFLKWAGAESVELITQSRFKSAKAFLERKIKQKGASS